MFLFRSTTGKSAAPNELTEFEGIQFFVRRLRRRRKISMHIKPDGTGRITTPLRYSTRSIRAFLEENRQWVISTSQKFQSLREKYPRLHIAEGTELPLLGDQFRVQLQKSQNRSLCLRVEEKKIIFSIPGDEGNWGDKITQEKLRHTLRKHYRNLGQELLTRRVNYWTKITGLVPKQLSFRGQKTRWGSCSAQGRVSLNWKLICAEPGVIDYVIVHELCHLQHLNHSKDFWRLVENFCPNWKEKTKWLKKRALEFDFLNEKSELHVEV